MLKTLNAAIVALALLTGIAHGEGGTYTGYDLYRDCTSAANTEMEAANRLSCAAYIGGYISALGMANTISPGSFPACMPPLSVGDFKTAFEIWAGRHPGLLSQSSGRAMAAAMIEVYPCPSDQIIPSRH